MEVGARVLAAVAEAVGRPVELRGPTDFGESGSTFLLGDDLVLKLLPDVGGALADQERLVRLVGGLRARGHPAPTYLAAGRVDGLVFTVQERLPGRTLEPAAVDRGFDVATLLFYAYEDDAVRDGLWARAVAISGRPWTTVYLCHLVLRQVEWLRRHQPGSAEDERFTALATRVLDDCG